MMMLTTFSFAFLAQIPAMGYATYWLCPSLNDVFEEYPLAPDLIFSDLSLENAFVKIEFQENGTFILREKSKNVTFPNCHLFVDSGDSGDEYDFVPLQNEVPKTTYDCKATVRLYEQTPFSITFEIKIPWSLPENILDNRCKRSTAEKDFNIRTELTLYTQDPVVHIKTYIDNLCKDHLLQVAFPTGFPTDHCTVEEDFYIIDRKFKKPKGANWVQKPDTHEHQCSFVSLYDGEQDLHFTVINKGLPDYEISQNDFEAKFSPPHNYANPI